MILEEHKENVINLYTKGVGIRTIGKLYRVTDGVVQKCLAQNGVKIRTSTEKSESTIIGDKTKVFTKSIKKQIEKTFPVKLVGEVVLSGDYLFAVKNIISDKILYLCIDMGDNKILKVGQSTNYKNRIRHYRTKQPATGLIRIILFTVSSFGEMDEYESKIRRFLESAGHILPWDNTNNRLKKVQYES